MSCPACGSRGTPLTPHHFLRDSRQCGNPHCRTIYREEETADLSPATEEVARAETAREAHAS